MPELLLAALTGTLIFLSFPTPAWAQLVFVALVPLLLAISRVPRSRAFPLGWVAGCVFHLGACYWVWPTIGRFEHLSLLRALPFYAAFVAYQGLALALFAWGVAWMQQRRGTLPPLFVAGWWVIVEWVFPKAIPWCLGDPLAAAPWLRQAADVVGIYGLGFGIVLVNALLATTLIGRGTFARRMTRLGIAAGLLALWSGYGALRIYSFDHDVSYARDKQVVVGIVQGGLSSGRDDLLAANAEALQTYTALTDTFAPRPRVPNSSTNGSDAGVRPDLVVWPETVLRVYLGQDVFYREQIAGLSRRLERPILLGALDRPPSGGDEFNSAYFVRPTANSGPEVQVYHKQVLLPFGEHIPLRDALPFIGNWQTTGRFVADVVAAQRAFMLRARGTGAVVRIAPSICFEAMFPGAFNPWVREGAEVLVNVTDDGWFGDSAAPYEYLQAVTLRAVETRRWLVRASNSGVSAIVDPTGRIVQSLPLGAVGVLTHPVEPSEVLTPYVRWGDFPVALSLLIAVATAALVWLQTAPLHGAGEPTAPTSSVAPPVHQNSRRQLD